MAANPDAVMDDGGDAEESKAPARQAAPKAGPTKKIVGGTASKPGPTRKTETATQEEQKASPAKTAVRKPGPTLKPQFAAGN